MTALSERELYDLTARQCAAQVIGRYSTSFSAATRLLGPRVREHVRTIYALVRVVDEIVDGPGRDSVKNDSELKSLVDDVQQQTLDALQVGFSPNLVIHAFALTARECGIGAALIEPFFESMRVDIDTVTHDKASHETYVYGSAEVVGLMCLQVFVNAGRFGTSPAPASLRAAARRLGAAFQDVNFLRDIDHDRDVLGRNYLAADAERASTIERIRCDLAAAARAVRDLPRDCRAAVSAAHDLFAALCDRLERVEPASRVRVSVPTLAKLGIVVRAAVLRRPRKGKR